MSKQPKVLLAHPGIQHAPRLAEQLERQGMLARFWTGWAKAGAGTGKRQVAIPSEKIRTRPWVEWIALCLQKSGLKGEQVWAFRNRLFQKLIPESEILQADVVVGFDTAADILADRCCRAGIALVLDQTTPRRSFKKKIFQELGIRPQNNLCSPKIVIEGEKKEQEADTKIVVASSFCRKSFEADANLHHKTRVIPYGLSASFLSAGHDRDYSKPRERLRFIYVGNLGWHKGIKILLQAWSSIISSGASLRVVGRGSDIVEGELRRAGIELVGQLDTAGVAKEMSEADVLLFPSFFEGFGRVILEGMAAGLPVIATANTGGPDVMEEGKEGFIVPAGSAGALREKMEWLIQNPSRAVEMGRQAHARATQFTWETYGQRYREEILG